MASIKGITVEIGGSTVGLQNALKDVNKRSRELTSELKSVENALKFNPGNVELLAQKQQLLSETVENTTEKLNQLRQAQAQVERQYQNGDIGAEAYRQFQRELITTESRLNHYTNQLREMDQAQDSAGDSANDAARDIDKMGNEAQEADGKLSKLGGGFKTAMGAVAAGAAAGAAAIGGLVTGMEDYNRSLARLSTNASNAGFDLAGAEDAMQRIAVVSGDTEAAVETVSNLMQTGFSDAQLASVIDEVNGAAIRFSDTLNTEGIADGIQETFATGSAVGMFGELLERSGVSLDTFNAGLAEAKKNGTETDYMLQQMADLGLASAYEEYKKLNPELVAQAEAQQRMTDALAAFSLAMTPLVTTVTEFLTKIIEWSNENIALVKSFDSIGEGLSALLPQMLENGKQILTNITQGIQETLPELIATAQTLIPEIIGKIKEYYPTVIVTGHEILVSIIDGIIQMLPSLISAVAGLIETMVMTIVNNLPKLLDSGVKLLKSLIDGIAKTLPDLAATSLKLIVKIVTTLIQNLPKIVNTGMELITALINGILSMVGNLANAIMTDVIPSIMETLEGVDLKQIGKDIIQGLIDGIASMASAVWKKVQEIANSIKNTLKDALDINSPSRVMMDIGKNTVEGLVQGIEQNMRSVSSAANQMANAVAPDTSSISNALLNGKHQTIIYLDSEVIGNAVTPIVGQNIAFHTGRF